MIEIIAEKVKIPTLNKRRYQVEFKNERWFVFDTKLNKVRYKGCYEMVMIASYNLNKKYYRNNNK